MKEFAPKGEQIPSFKSSPLYSRSGNKLFPLKVASGKEVITPSKSRQYHSKLV